MWLSLLLIGAALAAPEEGATEAVIEPAGSVTQTEPGAPQPEEIQAQPVAEPSEAPPAAEVKSEEAVAPPATEPKVEGDAKGLSAKLTAGSSDGRIWHLRGDVMYRQLAVTDATPANDLWMTYRLRADIDVFPHARAFIWGGIQQKFWAQPDESGWFLQDLALGMSYTQEVKLDFVPLDFFKSRKLDLAYVGRVYLPTSRASINQDLYVAPEALTRASFAITDTLSVVSDVYFQYRLNRYAEQAGLEGGMNNQLSFGPSLGLEYTFLDDDKIGTFTAGADVATAWGKKYGSRDEFSSTYSSEHMWTQDYGWDAYVTYTPWKYTTVVLTLQQGGPVLRDGIVNTFFVKREETELVLWAIAHY